jgi:site-specific recombinase XerD
MKTNQTYGILFWIKKSKIKNGKAPIYCRITINGKRAEISTKRFTEPEKWSSSSSSIKGKSEEDRTINAHLDNIRSSIHTHYTQLSTLGKFITAETLKNNFLGLEEKERTLIETYEYHNSQMKDLIGIDVVESTLSKYVTVLNKLKPFLKKKYKRSDVFLKELNHKFVVDFEYYLKVEDEVSHNTTMKYIRDLKKVMNMAVTNEWIVKNPFANFKCSYKKVVREILTEKELETFANKEFSIQRLEEVRDIFLFCCYTGYSFVDVERLTPNDVVRGIDGGLWIYANRKKTGTQSNVPLLPTAQQIIEKYKEHPYCEEKGKLLPVKSNQKMNAYLKEIADLCEINKKLTMHISRHTFATTVTLSNGVPIETVSRLLGHTKLATTQIYAQVLEHKVSEDMLKLKERMEEKTTKKTEQKIKRTV